MELTFMEVVGYIALVFFALVGFVIAALAIFEYLSIQTRLLGRKVAKEVEVRNEHIDAQGEAKKIRLAKKRTVTDAIKSKRMDRQLNRIKTKANTEFGAEVFTLDVLETPVHLEEVPAPVHTATSTPAPAPAPESASASAPTPVRTSKPVIKPSPRPEPADVASE